MGALLDEAIAAYQLALENLSPQSAADCRSTVASVLVARDNLAHVLSNFRATTSEALNCVTALDQRLQANATTIDATVGRSTLARWRETVQPPVSAWWWYLDERAILAESKPPLLWAILAGFFITVSLSLIAEISQRFLSGGADFLSVFSTLSQGLLALLAGSTLTQVGQQGVERALSRLGIERKFRPIWTMGLALAVLLVVLAWRCSLPPLARYYNNHGVRLQQGGQMTSAIESYQRAIRLYPDYAQAHYNLATAYEDMLEYDKALVEYHLALHAEPQLYLAYNNLARLYMLRRNDFHSALRALNTALALKLNLDKPQQLLVQYTLFKNRGWANFGLKYFGMAEADLREALTLRPDGAAAHCLLAQVFEAQEKPALSKWENCVRYEKSEVVEADWLGLARERLSRGRSK